jgi:hypothetical protein
MFGYFVAGAAALLFGGIAYKEATKTTGEKVKAGDTTFVRADALRVSGTAPNPAVQASLQSLLAGFMSTSVKVSGVQPLPGTTSFSGTIVGFPQPVVFDRSAVVSIERNGARIT